MNKGPTTTRRFWIGVLALVGCATLWSLGGPLIKLLDQTGLPGITIAYYRSLFGGALFLPLAWRHRATLRSVRLGWPIAALLTFTFMTVCFVIGTTMTAAANIIILQYTSPVWVFLLSPLLLRERPALRDGLVLSVAMVGVAIIFFWHPVTAWPALMVGLASGLGYGALTVALRGLRSVSPSVVVTMNFIGSALLLAVPTAKWGVFGLTGWQLTLALLLGIIQMALPYLLFSWALQYVEAHRAALIVLLETILNPLLTYLIVGEDVPTATLIGGPLILLSVVAWVLLTWRCKLVGRQNRGVPADTPLPQRSKTRL